MVKKQAIKNKWGKTVAKEKAYYVGRHAGFTWYVLKVYGDPRKQFARAYCMTTSPMCPDGELGDEYAANIPGLTAAWVKAHEDKEANLLLPLHEHCVICQAEGRHEAERPHVMEGQE